jgi:hypothetical protein
MPVLVIGDGCQEVIDARQGSLAASGRAFARLCPGDKPGFERGVFPSGKADELDGRGAR